MEIRLLFDTGTFMLIWLVQLIIYPSFLYYTPEAFLKWHRKYTASLTIIVAPLLAGQGLSVAYQFFTDMSLYTFSVALLISSVTVFTFVFFMPLHMRLQNAHSEKDIRRLIYTNWFRTLIWSLVLLIDVGYWLLN